MLVELVVNNFALVEHQSVRFGPGLNVISGETGAGKSIILQALELMLGARASTDYIRKGTEGWELQALFDLSGLSEELQQELPDCARGEELLLSRSLNASGKGRVYINGRLGTVSLLQEIAEKLINICGQGHQTRLLNAAYHCNLVDNYAGLEKDITAYRAIYDEWRELSSRISTLREQSERNVLRRAELEFVVEELRAIDPHPDRRAMLEEEVSRLSNAEELIRQGDEALQILNSDQGILVQLSELLRTLRSIMKIDKDLNSTYEGLEACESELLDCERELTRHFSSLETNEEELDELRERLAEVARLERKYRTNSAGLVEILKSAEQELAVIEDPEVLDAMETQVQELHRALGAAADKLAEKRKKAGATLVKEVVTELAELNMPDARLRLSAVATDFGPNGNQAIEFLFAPHRGEDFRPLKAIASGGELSRIMLVLKKVLRDRSGVNVLVFDEVDTGISGGVARAVGVKLKALSSDSQVICITHLAQVASLADQHLRVAKQRGNRIETVVSELNEEQRVEEVARMLAGYKVTEASRESARELISSKA